MCDGWSCLLLDVVWLVDWFCVLVVLVFFWIVVVVWWYVWVWVWVCFVIWCNCVWLFWLFWLVLLVDWCWIGGFYFLVCVLGLLLLWYFDCVLLFWLLWWILCYFCGNSWEFGWICCLVWCGFVGMLFSLLRCFFWMILMFFFVWFECYWRYVSCFIVIV